ncbi:MAG: putative glycolipid-binding domain-containing protein, partial [Hyphomicrobiales bacterium]|nr:putative glycolipid-binding domain-containing protein [Hyphomicrobiales bacterium]
DRPGHDTALLMRCGDGWLLQGAAVFAHDAGPANVAYEVETDPLFRTRRGRVSGFLGEKPFHHDIRREADGWSLNGAAAGLEHLADLDYGFTPATNILQLRRAAPGLGQTVSVPVAWFDVGAASLIELPQRYERRGEATYWYVAPTVPYEALLEIASNGFVQFYPGLWRLVTQGALKPAPRGGR